MAKLSDVNTTNIVEAIRLGCHTMQNVFDADDNDIPFFGSVVYPAARLSFSAAHSESHVPGRHLNALLNAMGMIGIDIDESAVIKHRRAAFYAFSGSAALSLNRPAVGEKLVNFSPHNLREGIHALYSLVKFRDDDEAFEIAKRCIADVFDLWNPNDGWDESRLRSQGIDYKPCQGFIHGEARMMGPLAKLYHATGYGPALELALLFKDKAISECYSEDGEFEVERFVTRHTHSITCTLSSLAQLADLTHDSSLLQRVRAFYENGLWEMRDELGWSPERALLKNCDDGEMNNTGDIVETALILGRNGYPEYYEDAERIVRCHVLPAQLRDVSFIEDSPNPHSIDGLHNLAWRHRGAFGFPAPYGHAALGEGRHRMKFNMDVVGGTVGSLCEVQQESARTDAAGHWVNMHFDAETENVKVRSPYTYGCLEIEVLKDAPLFVRIPSWINADDVAVCEYDGQTVQSNGYLFFAQPPTGKPIRVEFPLKERELTLSGTIHVNPIPMRLRGDSVATMENFETDFTFFDSV